MSWYRSVAAAVCGLALLSAVTSLGAEHAPAEPVPPAGAKPQEVKRQAGAPAGQTASREPAKEVTLVDLMALPVSRPFASSEHQYLVDEYLKAAIALQRMGKGKASELLLKLAKKDPWPNTRALVLCRMLFEARPKHTFRRALIGGPVFVADPKQGGWTLEPIDIEDGIPFLVVWGYFLAGHAEDPADYVKYCLKECNWRGVKYELKTAEQKRKALAKITAKVRAKERWPYFEAQLRGRGFTPRHAGGR